MSANRRCGYCGVENDDVVPGAFCSDVDRVSAAETEKPCAGRISLLASVRTNGNAVEVVSYRFVDPGNVQMLPLIFAGDLVEAIGFSYVLRDCPKTDLRILIYPRFSEVFVGGVVKNRLVLVPRYGPIPEGDGTFLREGDRCLADRV